jgi:Zn-dependent metalloprotease
MTRKTLLALLAVGATAACSSAPETISDRDSSTEGATKEQLSSHESLERATQQRWTWIQHEGTTTPAHLSSKRVGAPLLTNGLTAERATKTFLAQYKELYRLRDPESELSLSRERKDELGMTHARFQQVTHGVPVLGAELMAHYDREGHLTSIDAQYVPGLVDVDVNPTIDPTTALSKLKSDALARAADLSDDQLEAEAAKLVVYAPPSGTARLAFQYTVRAVAGSHPAIWVTTVDAKTGEVLNQYDNLQTVEGTAVGALGDAKKFEVSQVGTGFAMTDASRGITIRTFTAQKQQTTPGTTVTSGVLTQWDTGVTGAGAAVDAHTYAGIVFDYYKTKHARTSLNGAATMESTAHFGTAYDNAFWDGRGMTYGDGGELFRPLSAGLDVVAHEFTHGVTESESNLVYQGQSGALNEAVSDIFGAFIEHAAKPDPSKNWMMGEAITKGLQAGLMRDFKNPASGQQPAHMTNYRNTQQDNGGVHINSGIINNAAFLMTAGGKNPVSNVEVKFGIGWDKSEKLWYRASTQYFTQSTNFAQAAQGVMQAAKDIQLTQNEQNIVECAWKAVGIGTGACAQIVDPNPVPQSTPVPPTTPGTDTEGPGTSSTPTESTSETGTVGESGDDDSDSKTSSTSKPRRTLGNAYDSNTGCSTTGSRANPDLLPLAGLIAAVIGLARKRRQR